MWKCFLSCEVDGCHSEHVNSVLSAEVGALQLGAFHFSRGIEMKFKNQLFPMIVCPAWIPELNAVEHGPEGKGGPA